MNGFRKRNSHSCMPAYQIRITGRVQGVFFRSSTKEKADELGVAGWVKNVSDGSVEVFAEGDEQKLQELIGWCRKGPEQAQVERVEIAEVTERHCKGFRIE